MEGTLVWGDLLNLVVNDELLEGLGGGAGAVQGLVANDGDGRRLVSHRLGDLEVVERWCADRPCVAEERLGFAIKVRKLGRIRLRGHDGERSLVDVSVGHLYVRMLYVHSMPWLRCHTGQSRWCCRRW